LDKLIDNRSYDLGRSNVILSRLDAEQADRALIKNVVGHSTFGEQPTSGSPMKPYKHRGLLWCRSKTVLPPASR
jgi:hypothetical protein